MNIDTLSIARDLRATELPREQAEAIAAAVGRAVVESTATKADLDMVRVGLKADLEQVRAGLEAKIDQGRSGSKAETEQVRSSLDARIEQVRGSLKKSIEQVRTEIERSRHQVIVWVISVQAALAGIIIAVVKL